MAECALEGQSSDEWIVELGAGTGRFTRALIEAGIPEERLLCIEIDPFLAEYLQEKFPKACVLTGNACYLEELMEKHSGKNIRTIISGLPMLNFAAVVQQKILRGCFHILKEEGQFLQFSYSPFASLSTSRFPLQKRHRKMILLNFPPASIWSYTQKEDFFE